MRQYASMAEAIADLSSIGYTFNFKAAGNCLVCDGHAAVLEPNDFEIDEVHRFQEMSDVENESILYAISSKNSDVKGLLVSAFGVYADPASAALVAKLTLAH